MKTPRVKRGVFIYVDQDDKPNSVSLRIPRVIPRTHRNDEYLSVADVAVRIKRHFAPRITRADTALHGGKDLVVAFPSYDGPIPPFLEIRGIRGLSALAFL